MGREEYTVKIMELEARKPKLDDKIVDLDMQVEDMKEKEKGAKASLSITIDSANNSAREWAVKIKTERKKVAATIQERRKVQRNMKELEYDLWALPSKIAYYRRIMNRLYPPETPPPIVNIPAPETTPDQSRIADDIIDQITGGKKNV